MSGPMSEMWTKSPNWGMQGIKMLREPTLHEQGNTAGIICINNNVKGCVTSQRGYSAFPKSQMKIKQSQVNTSFTPKSMIAQKDQLFKILCTNNQRQLSDFNHSCICQHILH
ncbi:hypothetical protein CEXT_798321 [Caerostris extrusa]|uniref:Uncharacterized protein n=1 Tax=Caerostris extrusa TaxID=172846 RepID=A0AAV4TSC3_CAEEX|nr:hypothetical protein CEXT_798321 [Caerostris extrusa]